MKVEKGWSCTSSSDWTSGTPIISHYGLNIDRGFSANSIFCRPHRSRCRLLISQLLQAIRCVLRNTLPVHFSWVSLADVFVQLTPIPGPLDLTLSRTANTQLSIKQLHWIGYCPPRCDMSSRSIVYSEIPTILDESKSLVYRPVGCGSRQSMHVCVLTKAGFRSRPFRSLSRAVL